MTQCLYIYGLVSDSSAARLTSATFGEGLGGGMVSLLPAGAFSALASDIPPGPVAPTRRNMIAHTSVLERVTAEADVLPLRFGTVASSVAALARCVAGSGDRLNAALTGIRGRIELGLRASWRDGIIFNEIIQADAALLRLRDRLRTRPATETYYERVELGRRVEAALSLRRVTETEVILKELRSLAEQEADLGKPGEEMIFNRAFLVGRADEARFDGALQKAGARYAERVAFRYIGPVPPYNFVNLQLDWMMEAA